MIAPLRRVGIAVLAMFVTLFLSASYLQVVASEDIADDDRNVRKLYESFSAERGQILAGGIQELPSWVSALRGIDGYPTTKHLFCPLGLSLC